MADTAKKVKAPAKKAVKAPVKKAPAKDDQVAALAKEFALAFADEGMAEADATKYGRVAADLVAGDA